jgi:ketosteroid isomerase-like protein
MDRRAEIVAELYRALRARDWDGLAELFANDAEFSLTGRNPHAGSYSGPQPICEALRRLVDDTSLAPHREDTWDVCTSDHHVIFIEWLQASRKGRRAQFYVHLVCAFEGGLIKRAFANFVDQYEFDGLWS